MNIRLAKILTAFILFSFCPFPVISQVIVQVDAASERKVISPWIYGKNNSLSDSPSRPLNAARWQFYRDAGVKMMREGGGNNSTKYNWRLKLSSHPDWYNNVYAHDWDYLARSLQENLPGVQGLLSFQLISKTAKTSSYNFNDWNYNRSQYWSGVRQNLAGGGIVNPSGGEKAQKEGDPNLYLMNWPADSTVGILDNWFGTKGLGINKNQFLYWNLDNEPEIWSGTHDDVMPVQLPPEDFMIRYFDVAKKAREKFPEIKLVGPVPANEWQWYNWNGGRIYYDGKNYVWLEYFIKRIADEQKATGIRLLDVLDIHFYPGDTNPSDILQLHRVYFDRTFNYPRANGVRRLGASGWDTSITKEYILERCNEWLTQYIGPDHGVTFSVTETDVQTSDPNIVAVWYASTLGEFMKQKVEIFTPWIDYDKKPGMWEVLHLFSRYNQKISNRSVSNEEEFVSAYSSVTQDDDSMTIVLVNRSVSLSKDVSVNIAGFSVANGEYGFLRLNSLPTAETFRSHQDNALKTGKIMADNNSFSIQIPPLSVTSVILKSSTSGRRLLSIAESPDCQLFPNPANEFLHIRLSTQNSGMAEIRLIDVHGRTRLNKKIQVSGTGETLSVPDIHFLQQGVYFVNITVGNRTYNERIIFKKHL